MMIEWIIPLAFVLAGLLAGIIGEKVFYKQLRKFVTEREIPGSDIIFASLHRMTFLWFALAGFLSAIVSAPLQPGFANVLEKIFTTILLYSVTLVLARLASGFVTLFVRKSSVGVPTSLLSNITKITILILGTLILLQTVGIKITPIVTTLGISGLAVGLALQDTLANLFSGFYLVISNQVRTGDYVKLEDANEGYVTDINWRNTTIKEISNNVVIVPNSKLASAIFTNYNLPEQEITLTLDVGVSYDSDLELVEQVTVEVAKEVMKEIAPELIVHEPYMRFHTFNDSSIDYTLYMRVSEYFDQRIGKHLLVKKLHKRYKQEGIQIPFPIRDVFMHN